MIDNLVFDRAHSDVVYADDLEARIKQDGFDSLTPAEQQEWSVGLKGRYTIADLNRVESAVQLLADALRQAGYSVSVETRKWEHDDIPSYAEMQRYLNNIKELIRVFGVAPTTPAPPDDMEYLNVNAANNIERILRDIAALLDSALNTVNLGWAFGMAHIGLFAGSGTGETLTT